MSVIFFNLLAISVGAAFGANLRWVFGLMTLNWQAAWPLGTLAANWVGAYLIGLSWAYFSAHIELPPIYRLLVVTGFLGGLTTFSTFSLETVQLLQAGRYGAFASHFLLHTVGCMALTVLGMASYRSAGL